MWGSLAFAYLILARVGYALGVGIMLTRQERHQAFTRRYGVDGGYTRFKRISTLLMLNDGGAFILLCVVTANTMHLPVPRSLQIALGLVIGVFGIAIKTWATARLGPRAYYWYNFFVPSDPVMPDPPGPYRYLKNPMYGVGYLQTYGLALVCASLPGMLASVFMQASILLFNELVEKPHFKSLLRNAAARRTGVGPGDLEQGATPRFT
jgi:isoprenylcysteine carboxyl methyltransferase (ICMT) family protein YpbQ